MSDALLIRLSGDCSIRSIRTVHREIEAALMAQRDLNVDCAEVERADMALVQLLVAASNTAKRQTRRVTLVDPSDVVRNAFVRAGLQRHDCLAAAA